MILYDSSLVMRFRDYGIMLPISPDRGQQTLNFLGKNFYPGARGKTMPYPGPVFSIARARALLNGDTVTRGDLERVHSKDYIAALYGDSAGPEDPSTLEKELLTAYELLDARGLPRRYEPDRAVKPLAELFTAIMVQASGTYLACRLALAEGPGFCYYLGGGMHHARYDGGAGFCLINDVAIAAAKILADTTERYQPRPNPGKPVRLIWIIDLDAHKGDGTAELIRFARQRGELAEPAAIAGSPAPCILTLSVHMAKGWPLDEETLAAGEPGRAPLLPSDIDIAIDSGDEADYTPRLAEGIKKLERMSAAFYGDTSPGPDLILVVDGADPYEHDGLLSSGLLRLTLEQCLERDNFVYRYAIDRNIPSAWIQAGGYGERAWEPGAYFLQGIR
jgi:acetoin utilization deacetylase AcuC-like enzyme